MGKVLGIDLGTTYSCVAYIDEFDKAVVLQNDIGASTTPSVVYIESKDNVVVGEEAKRTIKIEPERTIQFIKRKIGKPDNKVMIDGTEYTPEEISSYILKKLVQDANDKLEQMGCLENGEFVKDVVITCPAYFGMNEKESTKIAGEMAGLNVLSIINEPTAAAISYGVNGKNKNETVLVYDLGGGTFDITVMKIDNRDIEVVCSGGDDTLGGKDWDEALISYVVDRVQEEFGVDLYDDPEAISALYLDAETWKKSLTQKQSVRMTVQAGSQRFKEELTREKYEEITRDLLNRTKNLMDDVLRKAKDKGYAFNQIDRVLLVGGSSRMPQVAKMIADEYGVTPSLQDPDEAVAKGAAIYAQNRNDFIEFVETEARRTGKNVEAIIEENNISGELDKRFELTSRGGMGQLTIANVTSRTYGVSAYDENDKLKIFNMIMINEKLPIRYTETFCTKYDNQSGVNVEIYETRSTERQIDVEDKQPITTIHMTFNRAVPANSPIETTFSLDNSGILHIVAHELTYGSKLDTTFALSNVLSDDEKRVAMSRIDSSNVE